MNAIKERILGAVTIMDNDTAVNVWNYIISLFPSRSWENIEEIIPDEWDKKMLADIATNPECHEFFSSSETMKELDL